MQRVRITNVAVAHPQLRITQAEAAAGIARAIGESRRVAALARGARIDTRAICLPPAAIAALSSIESRNAIYRAAAPALAIESAGRALGETPREAVAAVVSSSCTGYALPGWGSTLLAALGLPAETVRLPITEAGCAGGVVALARAADHLRFRPGTVALAAAVELCSLSFRPAAGDSALAAALLFGDGAGAALLATGEGPGLEILDSMSVLVPGTADALGFDLTDRGFSPVISRALPDLIPGPAAEAIHRLLARNHLESGEIGAWLIHPGGARILRALERALGTGSERMRWSWDSMREFGNTSSAAIFDVLRRYFESDEPAGHAVVAAFGPGVSIELLLVRRTC